MTPRNLSRLLVLASLAAALSLLGACATETAYTPQGFSGEPVRPGSPTPSRATARDRHADPMPLESVPNDPHVDELWIIERATPASRSRSPGPRSGTLLALDGTTGTRRPLVLRATDVNASITGFVSTVTLKQVFENPTPRALEAQYLFPLPQNAAVTGFVFTVGERRIRGVIREREEAREIYEQARRRGHAATLLSQERPNIFTQRVANIPPGEQIAVNIDYFHTLRHEDGAYEFVFPMTITPRYNPPGWPARIISVPEDTIDAASGEPLAQFWRASDPGAQRVSIDVEIDAGAPIARVNSPTHAVATSGDLSEGRATVRLDSGPVPADRDFILRYEVVAPDVAPALFVERSGDAGAFALLLHPPRRDSVERLPLDVAFVIDASGSMEGTPLDAARRTARRIVRGLESQDTFEIIEFAGTDRLRTTGQVPVTPDNIDTAMRHIGSIRAEGATRLLVALDTAMRTPPAEGRLRWIIFLTDGAVSDEQRILAALRGLPEGVRLLPVGVGRAPNRFLIERMARLGAGVASFVHDRDDAQRTAEAITTRLAGPALRDVEVEWPDADVFAVHPERIDDLYPDRPLVITGRFRGEPPTRVVVRGRAGGSTGTSAYEARPREATRLPPGTLTRLWARAQIADLADDLATGGPARLIDSITTTGLAHGLATRWTSFVGVDALTRTGAEQESVRVPSAMPAGTSMGSEPN